MKLELTDSVSGKKMVVDSDKIMLLEESDSGGSHVVLDPSMGRMVKESPALISALLGVVSIPDLSE